MLNIKEETRYELIDSLLDSYNENMVLYRLFGDVCYKERANHFIEMLKRHFKQTNGAEDCMEYF